MTKQDEIVNLFMENLNKATRVINSNTTRPYNIEICKNVIGRYDNLIELYNNLDYITKIKDIKPIIKLFAILCYLVVNLIVSLKTNDENMKEKTILKINIIQESICDCV
jgi:hypothetical protein